MELDRLRQEQEERLAEGRNPIGVGFGAFVERSGGAVDGGEYGRVEIDRAGSITVRTGSASSGQGHETAWAQLAADALGASPDDVRYVAGDTDEVAQGTGTFASRSAQVGGAAIWRTAHVVRRKAIELLADVLDASPEDLVLADGNFSIAGVPGTEMSWSEVAEAAQERGVDLAAEEWYVPGAQTFPYGVHVAVVEVDLDTGDVRLDRIVAVDDCGNVINPMIVEGQLHGSLMQGIGQALYEGVQYSEEGQLLTSTLMDYAMPRATDAPPVIIGTLGPSGAVQPSWGQGDGRSGLYRRPSRHRECRA